MKSRKPLFSIITINLNNALGLKHTIESVISQTFKNYEFIIIDGGSNDDSVNYIKIHEERISKWLSETDKGQYDAMNKGIKLSKGKYLIFLNAGDTFYNNGVLQKLSKRNLKDPVYYGILHAKQGNGELFKVDFGDVNLDLAFFLKFALPHQATLFRNDVFNKYGLYDREFKIAGDHDYFCRLIKEGAKISYLPISIAIYDTPGITGNPKSIDILQKEKSSIYLKYFDYPSIHFVTMMLNVEIFIPYQIEILKKLPFRWHWHIIEGIADLKYDTAWSVPLGGNVPASFHKEGRSIDKTSEMIDNLKRKYPDNITIYRKPRGVLWDGKMEMMSSPLPNIKEPCLLWELDCDEFWTLDQIIRVRDLFIENPDKTAAYYLSHVFVGVDKVLKSFNSYGNTLSQEWLRTWRYLPGDRWVTHEPPRLFRKLDTGEDVDITKINTFEHVETYSQGLIFQHFSYVSEAQLKFKEDFYGSRNALSDWKRMQKVKSFPFFARDYLSWVRDNTIVNSAKNLGVTPLMFQGKNGRWKYLTNYKSNLPKKDDYSYLLAQNSVMEKSLLIQDNSSLKIQVNQIQNRLNQIDSSRGWRFVTFSRRVLYRIFPEYSFRRKLLIILFKSTRFVLRMINPKITLENKKQLIKLYLSKFLNMKNTNDLTRIKLPKISPPIPPYSYKHYDYLDWLRFANPGMTNDGNIYCFEYVVSNLHSSSPMIEIGSFCGLSTNIITFYLDLYKRKNQLFTCDKWIFENSDEPSKLLKGSRNVTTEQYKDFVKDTYLRNIQFFSKKRLPYTIEEFSNDFFKLWKRNKVVKDVLGRDSKLGGKICFAFIDGNHSYEFAKNDFKNVDTYLEPGGFILFDDSADGSQWDVCKVVEEVKRTGRYEVIVHNPNYLMRKLR